MFVKNFKVKKMMPFVLVFLILLSGGFAGLQYKKNLVRKYNFAQEQKFPSPLDMANSSKRPDLAFEILG